MKTYDISRLPMIITLGYDGENNWRPNRFDCSVLLANHPNGVISLWLLPHGETQAFPVALERDGNTVVWTPLSEEMTAATGALQLVCTDGTDVGKSAVVLFRVDESIIPGAEHPAAVPSWATQTIERAEAAADRAEEAAESIDIEALEAQIAEAVEDYLEEHPIEAPVQSVNGKTGVVVLGASDVGALPSDTVIPPAVTEQDVAGWGFTKNTGTYSKPSGGIPKTDLASGVRTSLGKADTAYQKPSSGIPASDLAPGVIPPVPQMATAADMSDWTSGKTVDAAVLKADFQGALQALENVDDAVDHHASEISNLQTDKADKTELPGASTSAPVMDGTAAVGTSTDYARADHIHPSDTTRLSTTGNAYRTASIPMGHLDATSTATVMTATVDGITELRDGVCMWLRNGVVTSASGFTLNVNGLGAKPCYSSLAAESRSTTIFNANYTMLLIYNSTRVDGGCWDIVYGVDTNTTYTPPKLGFGYGTCTTAAATAAKTASISSYALTAGGIVSIHFDNDVPSGATLNVSSKGAKAMYYRGAAITDGVIKAGDTATFVYSTYYHLISVDRDESGDDLPSVTATDNGKFLRVVNGAWAAETVQTWQGGSY